jgi:hypothetical protein
VVVIPPLDNRDVAQMLELRNAKNVVRLERLGLGYLGRASRWHEEDERGDDRPEDSGPDIARRYSAARTPDFV